MDGLLNNPLEIQRQILTDYEDRIDGKGSIVDANNSFMFLLEAFSRTVASATVATDTKLNALYPRRATSTKDLYNHLSDFDYIGFFSTPASFKLSILLHKSYLVENAIQAPGTNYRLVIIPKDTIFSIGRFKFGLYYPIHIRINTIVNSVSAVYDTTDINPLHSLNTNTLPVRAVPYNGIDLVSIEFDTYQFDKVVRSELINTELGFIKKYVYDDKFYAVRVFDEISNKELSYTMSDSIYDPTKPTVQFKIFPENNEIQLIIPQIYFTSGLVNNKIKVELYTTLGIIDSSISNIELSDITANFALNNPLVDITYTSILRNIPTIMIVPINTRIVGGSDGYTFEQMKDHTIYHNDATTVPVTRLDLERYFKLNGFIAHCKLDNLTDRRYYSYKKLEYNDSHLGVVNGSIVISASDNNNRNIIYHNDDSLTILPTSLYKYIDESNRFTLVTDTDQDNLLSLSPQALANVFNADKYYVNPHHLTIDMADKYPICRIYDLLTVKSENLAFIEENAFLSVQLSVVSIEIRHLLDGSGGYTIRVGIQKTDELVSTSHTDINIFLTVTTTGGFKIGLRGTYVNTYNDLDVYDFHIDTSYKLTDKTISVTNLINSSGYVLDHEIDLSGEMYISTFVKKSQFSIPQNYNILTYLVDDDNSWLSVSVQKFDYTLGYNLSDVLDTNLLINWSGVTYATYEEDVLLTYEHDVYETNSSGGLVYSIDPVTSAMILNKLHSAGDIVLDDDGLPIIKYNAGDVKKDVDLQPITIANRVQDFVIEFSAYDYRHKLVESDFLINLSSQLKSYYDIIIEMNQNILENTRNFFRPVATSGIGTFKLNNTSSIITSLELSFEFNCYVPQMVIEDDNLLNTINTRIVEIISERISDDVISAINISSSIRNTISDYITSIDLISMNDNLVIQTLMNITNDKSPRLGFYVMLDTDGTMIFKPNVKVNFKSLDI